MCFQRLRRCLSLRPPPEAAFRQALLRDPETLRVVDQYFDSRRAPASEQEQAARKRIGRKFLPAQLRQRIDALPSVNGFNRDQDAQLRRDLNQDADSHNSRLSAAR